jgi:hypothetical protein
MKKLLKAIDIFYLDELYATGKYFKKLDTFRFFQIELVSERRRSLGEGRECVWHGTRNS